MLRNLRKMALLRTARTILPPSHWDFIDIINHSIASHAPCKKHRGSYDANPIPCSHFPLKAKPQWNSSVLSSRHRTLCLACWHRCTCHHATTSRNWDKLMLTRLCRIALHIMCQEIHNHSKQNVHHIQVLPGSTKKKDQRCIQERSVCCPVMLVFVKR